MKKIEHIRSSLVILAAGVIICGMFLLTSFSVSGVRQQRQAIQAIRDAGGRFYYDYQKDANGVWAGGKSWVPAPVQRVLGRALGVEWRDWFHEVGWVHFEGDRATDHTLAAVSRLPKVTVLGLWSNRTVTERGYSYIGRMKSLTYLSLQHSHLDDAGMRHLTELAQLKQLELNNTLISDSSVEHLKAFSGIEKLWIHSTKISKTVGRSFEAAFPIGTVDY